MKFINKKSILLFSILSCLLLGCNRELRLKTGEFRLKSQNFEGNITFPDEKLETLIQPSQKPNSKILGLPFSPKLGLYWFGKYFYDEAEMLKDLEDYKLKSTNPTLQLTERQQNRYLRIIKRKELGIKTQTNLFMREIGEEPAILDETKASNIAENIKNFYVENGFIDANVKYSIDYEANNNTKVTYFIKENKPFVISDYKIEIENKLIDSLVKSSQGSIIKINNRFKKGDFNDDSNYDEIDRIDTLLKNNGYFDFNRLPKYVQVEAVLDSTKKDTSLVQNVKVKLKILQDSAKNQFTKYKIGKITFATTDPFSNKEGSLADSLIYENVKYRFENRKYPIKLLSHKIAITSGQVFKQSNIDETQRKIYQLNQFGNVDVTYTKRDSNLLDITLKTPVFQRYSLNNELTSNFIQTMPGIGATTTFGVKNLLGLLETIEATAKISSIGQPALDTKIYRSLELGFNTSFNFPTILLPLKESMLKRLDFQRTQIKIGINYSGLREFQRTNFNLGTSYQFQLNKFENVSFSFLDLDLLRTNKTAEFQQKLDQLTKQGSNLAVQYGRQFVSSFSGSYIFNNSIDGKNTIANYKRIFLESGGTTLGFFKNQKLSFLGKFGGDSLDFFQFLKANFEYRQYIPVTAKNSFAIRTNVGVAYPYGKNKSLPFEKNFYIGGIRAWRPRQLGPGSTAPVLISSTDTQRRVLIQPGDIIFEGSLEFRHYLGRFYGDLNGAAFLDIGNIWKWHKDGSELRANANFDLKRFYNEFAIGTGYGIRLDLSYFILRYDLGVKIYDPSLSISDPTQINGFVVKEIFKKASNRNYPISIFNSTFGIGYPF